MWSFHSLRSSFCGSWCTAVGCINFQSQPSAPSNIHACAAKRCQIHILLRIICCVFSGMYYKLLITKPLEKKQQSRKMTKQHVYKLCESAVWTKIRLFKASHDVVTPAGWINEFWLNSQQLFSVRYSFVNVYAHVPPPSHCINEVNMLMIHICHWCGTNSRTGDGSGVFRPLLKCLIMVVNAFTNS